MLQCFALSHCSSSIAAAAYTAFGQPLERSLQRKECATVCGRLTQRCRNGLALNR